MIFMILIETTVSYILYYIYFSNLLFLCLNVIVCHLPESYLQTLFLHIFSDFDIIEP